MFLLWGTGAGECGFREIFTLLSGDGLSSADRTVLLELRLPRLITAFLAGGMLAASGAATQNLFRNELASPHVLGVIHASALGAVCGIFFPIPQVLFSFLFATAALLLIFLPGRIMQWNGSVLLLAGIAVNAFASALTSGVLYLANEKLAAVVFWMLGGFWRVGWNEVLFLGIVFGIGYIILSRLSLEMDMLLLGDRNARMAGVPLSRLKTVILIIVALMTAACVSCCGVIGFVGLAVPHIARYFSGAKFHALLPASVFTGGILLLLTDYLARTLAVPHEIPVGILTSAAGGPFFFLLLFRRRKSHD